MPSPANDHPGASLIRSHGPIDYALAAPSPPGSPDGDEADVALSSYLRVLHEQRWLIATITMAIVAAAALYAVLATPVYEANMLIHVEEQTPNASKNILNEVSSLFETKKAAIAEMELLRSRMVIAPAVTRLRLYIDAQPKYFPIAAAWLAQHPGKGLSTPGLFGYGGYAWAAEKIEVPLFDVGSALQNREFSLTALEGQRYRLEQVERGIVLEGVVGRTLSAHTSDGDLALRVDALQGLPGAQFRLRRSSVLSAIENVQTAMLISEQGKQSGVIEVRLQGRNAPLAQAILGEIGREYMRQNLARKTEEAEKSLAFLNTQLPELKRQLEQSESEYNQFRHRHGTIDLGEEAKISLQQAAAAKTRRIELMQKRTELLTRFTDAHPTLIGLNRQIRDLDEEMRNIANHIQSLPLLEQDEVRLTRDIKVNTDLYTALSNTAQQLRIISVGKVSNVRMVDAPMLPERPLKPNRPLILGAALVAGLCAGLVAAFARKAMQAGIDDPAKIEQLLGARVVYATIPHSANQDKLVRQADGDFRKVPLLAKVLPEDLTIESLRSLRAALQFSLPHFRNNIVMIGGPTSGLGKSFISANFASVLAASGKRVLLIDTDLRNGHLHDYFGSARQRGLSDAINGALRVDQVIRREVMPNLDFISTGNLPANRAEFLMHPNFGALLAALAANYDVVLLDPPPILAVADALIIGAHAGAVFVLVRAGLSTEGEIKEAIKRLNHAGIAPQGILFNDLALRLGNYGYQYKYGHISELEYGS
ncbi:MAG: polysaccharide biosynthesis tyrosine autokinase [Pseudomonadota bacterium]